MLEEKVEVVRDGRLLGHAVSLWATKDQGQVKYVTIAFGGWLGFGQHRVSVKHSDLRYDEDEEVLKLEKLRSGLGEMN